jgi:predicted Zn finger-like uncharacterized protein
MFTRCNGCHTVHPLNAAILAGAGGRYRCSKCNKVNQALDNLFDNWPEPGDKPPAVGELPVLGATLDLDAAVRTRREPLEAGLSGEGEEIEHGNSHWLRFSWIALGVVALAFALFWLADFYGNPISERPVVRKALMKIGLVDTPRQRVFRDLERIHLVNRELRAIPGSNSLLQLDATIVNRADRRQPYPVLEVILINGVGQVVSRSRFAPRDYLSSGSDVTAGMTPGAYLPFSVQVDDPGKRAVGFELEFH